MKPVPFHVPSRSPSTLAATLALAFLAAATPAGAGAQATAPGPAVVTPAQSPVVPSAVLPAGAANADTKTPGPAAAIAEPPPSPCESEDSETIDGDLNGGLANESFAAQRVRQKPTPATRIACALRKGRRVAALKIADDYLADHPRDAQVRFLRAVILGDMTRTTEATGVLESLIEDFPELPEPYNNLAVIRANQGDLTTAEHYLQLAIAAAPNYVTARENLGDLYISLAAAAYDEVLRLGPNNTAVKQKLTMARELGKKLHTAR